MGRILPQPQSVRQGCQKHSWRQLYRKLLLECSRPRTASSAGNCRRPIIRRSKDGIPPYETTRAASAEFRFPGTLYSPLRVKYPYLRGVLVDLWRKAKEEHEDPVAAWAIDRRGPGKT